MPLWPIVVVRAAEEEEFQAVWDLQTAVLQEEECRQVLEESFVKQGPLCTYGGQIVANRIRFALRMKS